jgi:hypothetical protein
MKRKLPELPDRYDAFLQELKERIRGAQVRAALSINRELVLLYWGIGRDILTRQQSEGWGAKVVDRLAHDLLQAFPGMTGFGARNLKYMRALAEATRASNLCNRSLHNCPGDIMYEFLKW